MFIDKNGVVRMPKAYLAGTEIFFTDSDETQEKYHQLCDKYGIIGYYPPDIAPEDEFKEYVKKDDSLHEINVQILSSPTLTTTAAMNRTAAQLWNAVSPGVTVTVALLLSMIPAQ